jgi:hypothetical protein
MPFVKLQYNHAEINKAGSRQRPLQKASLVVAAVCDRRRFPTISRSLGAHRAPLQEFCRELRRGGHFARALAKQLVALRDAGLLVTTPDPKDGRRMLCARAPAVPVTKTESGVVVDFGFCRLHW